MKNKKTILLLIAIVLLGFFLRVYNFKSFYVFSHDQDLASWVIKDILVNHHFRLIGQETSSQGVFIGALFYYLQIPFYLIGKMNPLPSVFLSIILGTFSIYSLYFVVSKIFDKKTGLISAFIYAVSALIVFTDREVVPTMPVMLWTIWYLYSLYLVYKGKQKQGFVLWGILLGLVWHLNLALVILTPLIFLILFFSKKKIDLKAIFLGVAILVIANLPFLAFETRHNFSQSKAVFLSLTTSKDLVEGTATGVSKLDRVMQLVSKNSISIFSKNYFVSPQIFFWGLVVLFIVLVFKKKIKLSWAIIFIFWQVLYIAFFSLNSLNVSEYYFNGMNIIWIIIFSLFMSWLWNKRFTKYLAVLLLTLFLLSNLESILNFNTDKKGYVEKIDLIQEIKNDSIKHGYPCISISYITDPGYNFGYRYLFWINKMHVNRPISGSPVYTIVFPHSLVDKIDMGFGSLGLIYPDYSRYNENGVKQSCENEDANTIDPMFGFTK